MVDSIAMRSEVNELLEGPFIYVGRLLVLYRLCYGTLEQWVAELDNFCQTDLLLLDDRHK